MLVVGLLYYLHKHAKEYLAGPLKLVVPFVFGRGKDNLSSLEKSLEGVFEQVGIPKGDKDTTYGLVSLTRGLLVGTGVAVLLGLTTALRQNFWNTLSRLPIVLFFTLFSNMTFKFALYFGLLMGTPHIAERILRKMNLIKNNRARDFLAGLVGGLSGMVFSSQDVTMFLGSKAVESVFYELVAKGILRPIAGGEIVLYAMSIATLYTTFAFEPHNLRASSFSSLLNNSGGQWVHLLKAFEKVREESGIPGLDRFKEWFQQVGAPLVKNINLPLK